MNPTGRAARIPLAALTAMLAVATLGAATARAQAEYDWSDDLPPGSVLRVYSVHGEISVAAATGRTARVRGRGTADRSGRYALRFETRRVGDGALVCVLYEEGSSCDERGLHTRGSRSRHGRANLEVELPRGVALHVVSGNGDVRVGGATADVRASSGNGEVSVGPGAARVDASSGNGEVRVDGARAAVGASTGNGTVHVSTTAGPVNASTGNGSIEVRMASLSGEGDMEFSSGNGTITLELPDDLSARVTATTGNGRFDLDFPVEVRGRISRHRLDGTIGDGGRQLRISTGNGNIRLRRSGG